jgi:hypothetical protein
MKEIITGFTCGCLTSTVCALIGGFIMWLEFKKRK